jgi:hypothetical protein
MGQLLLAAFLLEVKRHAEGVLNMGLLDCRRRNGLLLLVLKDLRSMCSTCRPCRSI